MSGTQNIEEMLLFILDREGALTSETTVSIVQGRMATESAQRDDILAVLDTMRRHGRIASAGATDVRGAPVPVLQWLVTSSGRERFLALQVPAWSRGIVDWLVRVPLIGDVVRAFIAAVRFMHRQASSKPAAHQTAPARG